MARANTRVLCHLKIYPDILRIVWTHLRRLETYEKKFSHRFPHTLSWYRMILPLSLDASFAPRSPQITPSDRHFGIRRILCSLLRHKSYLTLLTMLHRFEIHSALELSRTDCSYLVASRLCEATRWPAIIRFAIVIIILPVCNASQLTYQYATSIDNKFIINGCCIFRSYLAGLSMLYGSTPV